MRVEDSCAHTSTCSGFGGTVWNKSSATRPGECELKVAKIGFDASFTKMGTTAWNEAFSTQMLSLGAHH